MTEQERAVEGTGPVAAQVEPHTQGHRPPMRRGQQDEEPLVIEMAWLVIEAATALYRLRRILARL
jgi:hypothetical protein